MRIVRIALALAAALPLAAQTPTTRVTVTPVSFAYLIKKPSGTTWRPDGSAVAPRTVQITVEHTDNRPAGQCTPVAAVAYTGEGYAPGGGAMKWWNSVNQCSFTVSEPAVYVIAGQEVTEACEGHTGTVVLTKKTWVRLMVGQNLTVQQSRDQLNATSDPDIRDIDARKDVMLTFVLTCQDPPPPTFAILSVRLQPLPNVSGSCPRLVDFPVSITTNIAGTVPGELEFDDGTPASTRTFDVPGGSTVVSFSMLFSQSKSGSVRFRTGQNLTGWSAYSVSCQQPVMGAGGARGQMAIPSQSSPAASVGAVTVAPVTVLSGCPTTLRATGSITATAATQVQYTWERGDGTPAAPPKTLSFAGAGTQSVSDLLTLDAKRMQQSGGSWVALKIVSPSSAQSAQAGFTYACKP